MTRDFLDQFTDALDKEGFEYIILTWKDLSKGAHISSEVNNLDEEFVFTKRTTTKRESIIELLEHVLTDE